MKTLSRPGTPLLARLAPRRELLLKRSWMIAGYGRALPKCPPEDARALGRRLLRTYELSADQIIGDEREPYELREDQIIARPRRRSAAA